MNKHIAAQLRAIVITDNHLFKLDPQEKFKLKNPKKDIIVLKEIASITITDQPEFQLCVLNMKNVSSDFVFYLEFNDPSSDRVPELISNIYRNRNK